MDYAGFRYRDSKRIGNCESCKKIHDKRGLTLDCVNKCGQGFVELQSENWDCVALVEKYGENIFLNVTESGFQVNTGNIKNILEAEGYKGQVYGDMFHSLVLFFIAAIHRLNSDRKKT